MKRIFWSLATFLVVLVVGGSLLAQNTVVTRPNVTGRAEGSNGRVQVVDGTAAAPSIGFASDPLSGFYLPAANTIDVALAGGLVYRISTTQFQLRNDNGGFGLGAAVDVVIARDAAGVLALKNGANAQEFRVYGTTTGPKYLSLLHSGSYSSLTSNDTTGLNLQLNGGQTHVNGDLDVVPATIGTGSGTGVTVVGSYVRDQIYKVTVARTAFVTAGVTSDITIGTLPAKTQILGIIADVTQTFACTATCTSATLSMTLGTTAGGNEVLASFDADAATAVFGLADANLGTGMTRAAAIQGGLFGAWATTTPLILRLTSGTGNIGDGAATNLSQGSVTFYVTTRRF